jgi:hypothetical protein
MQRGFLIVLAAATALVCNGLASPAAAQDRYCLQGRIWGYPGNCMFATYQQCMASASGTDAYCDLNPQYAYVRPRKGHR